MILPLEDSMKDKQHFPKLLYVTVAFISAIFVIFGLVSALVLMPSSHFVHLRRTTDQLKPAATAVCPSHEWLLCADGLRRFWASHARHCHAQSTIALVEHTHDFCSVHRTALHISGDDGPGVRDCGKKSYSEGLV